MQDVICDHTTVGMLVRRDDRLLLIDRARPEFGWACPAGHMDGDSSPEVTARRELIEEVGLQVVSLQWVGGGVRLHRCPRIDGYWHRWHLYAVEVEGDVAADPIEANSERWADAKVLIELAHQTAAFLAEGRSSEDLSHFEPVWLEWLVGLNYIDVNALTLN